MSISKFFKKKELTPEEIEKREYNKRLKKLHMMIVKNPSKAMDYYNEILDVLDEMIEKGLYTEKEKLANMEKFNRLMNRFRKLRG